MEERGEPQFHCALTGEILDDPVWGADGRVYERHGGKQMVAELQRRTMAAEKSAMAAQASAEKAERRTATMRKWQVAQHAARIDALEKDLAATTLRRDEMTSRVVLLEKNAHKSQKRVKRQRHDMEAMQVRHM